MNYFINIDYLGTYNVELTKKIVKFKISKPGGCLISNSLKTACARNLNAKKLF